jgi:hypothetical protein
MVNRIVFWRVLYKHVRPPGFSCEHTEILQHDVYGKYDAAVMPFIVSQFKFRADFNCFYVLSQNPVCQAAEFTVTQYAKFC